MTGDGAEQELVDVMPTLEPCDHVLGAAPRVAPGDDVGRTGADHAPRGAAAQRLGLAADRDDALASIVARGLHEVAELRRHGVEEDHSRAGGAAAHGLDLDARVAQRAGRVPFE
jgi:hypothetical protein